MQDPASELRRRPVSRTWVNRGKKEGRDCLARPSASFSFSRLLLRVLPPPLLGLKRLAERVGHPRVLKTDDAAFRPVGRMGAGADYPSRAGHHYPDVEAIYSLDFAGHVTRDRVIVLVNFVCEEPHGRSPSGGREAQRALGVLRKELLDEQPIGIPA